MSSHHSVLSGNSAAVTRDQLALDALAPRTLGDHPQRRGNDGEETRDIGVGKLKQERFVDEALGEPLLVCQAIACQSITNLKAALESGAAWAEFDPHDRGLLRVVVPAVNAIGGATADSSGCRTNLVFPTCTPNSPDTTVKCSANVAW